MLYRSWTVWLLVNASVRAQRRSAEFLDEGLHIGPGTPQEAIDQLPASCRCQRLPSSACCRHPILRSQCQEFCLSGQCPSPREDHQQCPYCSSRLQARSPQWCPSCLRQIRALDLPRCPYCDRRLQTRTMSACPHCGRPLQQREVSLCPCCTCLCLPPDDKENTSTTVRPKRYLDNSPLAEDHSLPSGFIRSLSQLVNPRPQPFWSPLRRRKRAIITQNGYALLMETHLGPGATYARGKRQLIGPAGAPLRSPEFTDEDDPCKKMFSCRNGGTCVRKAFGEVRCRCLEGWSGRFCTHRN
ncbi:uncharacterized protein LOC122392397 [Amphibalanus amphitrite]|uniref:uncharacterized protein LOC122392397 n=1 Tax=Amphibalanus amphitrite TaxID=1232801 RepID=UPI001C91BE36|nr:uncharacterized protein LOC122392397 [Amphibalanus amphitrite]